MTGTGTPTRTVIVGQGYVGLPLAMRAVDAGHDVVGFDIDTARVARLAAGQTFIEDVTDAEVTAALATGRYLPTSDAERLAGFHTLVITVPTPLAEGIPDLSFIEAAASTIAPHLRAGSTVVLESTTYPGTTEELLGPILGSLTGLKPGIDFHLGYSPERIDPGNRTWTLRNTPKVVSGVNDSSLAAVCSFYEQLVDRVVPVSSTQVAELTKLMENTFRHVNVALANELAVFAAGLDIDIWESIEAASTKPYGFMPFTPGPGVGGHCLPVDPSYLSWQVRRTLGRPFRFVELANDVNDHMPDYVVQRIAQLLNRAGVALSRSRILVLGVAYKRNSSDSRQSPALGVITELLELGAEVRFADPHVTDTTAVPAPAQSTEVSVESLRWADVVVIVTDHDAFPYEMILEHSRAIFDSRARLEGPNVERL